jgi:hypothetical protein
VRIVYMRRMRQYLDPFLRRLDQECG